MLAEILFQNETNEFSEPKKGENTIFFLELNEVYNQIKTHWIITNDDGK